MSNKRLFLSLLVALMPLLAFCQEEVEDSVAVTGYESKLVFPNAFSPNGDGHNDVLYVRSAILVDFYFVVYNHWGQKIFETQDLHSGWDGTFKGKECPNGIYDFYFKGTCLDAEVFEKKGNVMLVR